MRSIFLVAAGGIQLLRVCREQLHGLPIYSVDEIASCLLETNLSKWEWKAGTGCLQVRRAQVEIGDNLPIRLWAKFVWRVVLRNWTWANKAKYCTEWNYDKRWFWSWSRASGPCWRAPLCFTDLLFSFHSPNSPLFFPKGVNKDNSLFPCCTWFHLQKVIYHYKKTPNFLMFSRKQPE